MSRFVVRRYPDACFMFDKTTREALFVEGSLAAVAPTILENPDSFQPQVLQGWAGIPKKEYEADLRRLLVAIRSFLGSPGPQVPQRSQDAEAPTVNPMKQLSGYARRRSQVITANFEVTHLCNQRCRTCFLEDFQRGGLDAEGFRRVLSQLEDVGIIFVSLTGGEIFVRPDVLDLLAQISERNLALEVKTNGTAIRPRMVRSIAQLQLLDLQVSLYECEDGWSPFTGTNYRFAQLLATLQDLQAAGVPLTVSILVGKHNIDTLMKYHDRLSAAGLKNVFYSPYITPSRTGDTTALEYRLSASDLQLKLRPFLERIGGLEHPAKYRGCSKKQPTCYAGRDQLAIDPVGTVYPCLDLRLPMGNILQEDLRDILQRRADVLGPFVLANVPKCRTCDVKAYCDSCVGTALLENGEFRVPSQHKCDITKFYCSAKN